MAIGGIMVRDGKILHRNGKLLWKGDGACECCVSCETACDPVSSFVLRVYNGSNSLFETLTMSPDPDLTGACLYPAELPDVPPTECTNCFRHVPEVGKGAAQVTTYFDEATGTVYYRVSWSGFISCSLSWTGSVSTASFCGSPFPLVTPNQSSGVCTNWHVELSAT